MSASFAPVNPTAAAGKSTVLAILQRDQERFQHLISEPSIWQLEMNFTNRLRKALRPKRWRLCDIVPHMTEGVEAYIDCLAVRTHFVRRLTGVPVAESNRTEPSQQSVIAQFSASSKALHSALGRLKDEDWTETLVPHPSPLNRDGKLV